MKCGGKKTLIFYHMTFYFPLKNAYACVVSIGFSWFFHPTMVASNTTAKGLRHHTAIDRMMGADDHLPGPLVRANLPQFMVNLPPCS